MKAEVYPSKDGWRFRVKGGNGEIMCVGESYVRRIDAESALKQLFGIGQAIEVTVRNHGTEPIAHYTLGREPNLDEVYTGLLDEPELPYKDPDEPPAEQ